ncbi:putative c6 zinc finger domain containing protein [Diplodia seriata]|uniref:Putative c6 zinc finger domain containing protein n=1 Tax=Diplodia seriata TaxID=420778 RepID=A0A0G2E136_9PEZI|nr:putative c6 zinc finger domain containing protein [Diplodia seriata]
MRSRTGCQTCRVRKLKCDERKPVCGPCTKASRECVYNSGLIFRHQQNASMNGEEGGPEQGLKGFYAYKNTFGHDAVWLDIPKQVRFWNTTDPYNEPMSPASETSPGSAPEQPPSSQQDAQTMQWPLPDSFVPPDAQSPAHALHALSAVATGDHYAYLHPRWMDLFDLGKYFASYVPVKAQTNPVLKYAAIAYSAKALGRVKGKRPIMGGNAIRYARTELYPNTHSVDWYHKATEYYDNAVSLLRQALQEDSRGISQESASGEGQWRPADGSDGSFGHQKRTSLSGFPVSRCSSDELLAATAILCVYEFLDASGPEWSRHLSGAKSLIDIAKDIINTTQTRLDTEDLPMWKDAGLQIDDNGFIMPVEATTSGYPEGRNVMKEDMISNSLVWLMSKGTAKDAT